MPRMSCWGSGIRPLASWAISVFICPNCRTRSVDVDVSYDDGATWRQTQVERRHGEWQVTVQHPATAGYVSLRVEAEGAGGAAVTEEIIRAYQLR